MASEYETVGDIVREMRTLGRLDEKSTDKIPRSLQALGLRTYADRIEAAAKQSFTNCNRLSNAAEMREALEKIASMGEQIDYQLGSSEETVYAFRHERCLAHNISEYAREALSAPPRNCDVGTAEEQYARVRAFCKRHKVGLRCVDCPVNGVLPKNCALIWAQIPYEEGGAK